MYCQQSLKVGDNLKMLVVQNVKRMSDRALKEGMKRQVLMLSNIKHLHLMKKITEKHAPEHFLLKMLTYVLNNDRG